MPRSVNLTALLSRLSRIWRSRLTSPISIAGIAGSIRASSRSPFSAASDRINATAPSTHSRRLKRRRLELHPAGLDLGEVEDVVDDREQRFAADVRMIVAYSRCSASSSRIEQQAAHADDGVHRRADLVAHGGQERALGGVGRVGRVARLLRARIQPRVVQGDHGELCKPLQPLYLGLRERARIGHIAGDSQRADGRVARGERHAHHRTDATAREVGTRSAQLS